MKMFGRPKREFYTSTARINFEVLGVRMQSVKSNLGGNIWIDYLRFEWVKLG